MQNKEEEQELNKIGRYAVGCSKRVQWSFKHSWYWVKVVSIADIKSNVYCLNHIAVLLWNSITETTLSLIFDFVHCIVTYSSILLHFNYLHQNNYDYLSLFVFVCLCVAAEMQINWDGWNYQDHNWVAFEVNEMRCILFSIRPGVCCYNGHSVHIQSNNTVNNCLSNTFQLNVICFEAFSYLYLICFSPFSSFIRYLCSCILCFAYFFYLSLRWLSKGWQNTTQIKHENITIILPVGCFVAFVYFSYLLTVEVFRFILEFGLISFFYIIVHIFCFACLILFVFVFIQIYAPGKLPVKHYSILISHTSKQIETTQQVVCKKNFHLISFGINYTTLWELNQF